MEPWMKEYLDRRGAKALRPKEVKYGGSTDLWGSGMGAADCKGRSFGVRIAGVAGLFEPGLFAMGKRDREAEAWIGRCREAAEKVIHQRKLGSRARIIGIEARRGFPHIIVGDPAKTFTVRIPFTGAPEFLCALFGPTKRAARAKAKDACPNCGHDWSDHCPAHLGVSNGCRQPHEKGARENFGVRICGCERQQPR